ncbi:MAG: SEC-C metal-binding domain-containing protein [Bacilli bacterium]
MINKGHIIQIISYSANNTKKGRTCGSGKKYKQCCGK